MSIRVFNRSHDFEIKHHWGLKSITNAVASVAAPVVKPIESVAKTVYEPIKDTANTAIGAYTDYLGVAKKAVETSVDVSKSALDMGGNLLKNPQVQQAGLAYMTGGASLAATDQFGLGSLTSLFGNAQPSAGNGLPTVSTSSGYQANTPASSNNTMLILIVVAIIAGGGFLLLKRK